MTAVTESTAAAIVHCFGYPKRPADLYGAFPLTKSLYRNYSINQIYSLLLAGSRVVLADLSLASQFVCENVVVKFTPERNKRKTKGSENTACLWTGQPYSDEIAHFYLKHRTHEAAVALASSVRVSRIYVNVST